jgi:hypothetical protein
MSRAIRIYEEIMTAEELLFITNMKQKEAGIFFRAVRNLSLFFIIVPCALSLILEAYFKDEAAVRAAQLMGQEVAVNNVYVLIKIFAVIFFIFMVGALIVYQRNLGKLVYDVKHKSKTIETSIIKRKHAIEAHQQFYLYLSSPIKYSIEVNALDYQGLMEGDEINIEYSTKAHVYFGYF